MPNREPTPQRPGQPVPWTSLLVLAVVGLGVLVLMALANPHLDIPVISKTVCSARGDVWFDRPDAWFGITRPGCYTDPSSPTPIPEGTP